MSKDTIYRQDAIDSLCKVGCGSGHCGISCDDVKAIEQLPSAQLTLHGYNIEHLELIARILQKEDLPPERVVEALTDIGRIVAIVRDEFEETLRRAVDQISRQGAIDLIMGQPPEPHYPSWYAEQIKSLPSAQPEIVRCKDCKHMITHEGYGYLGEPAYTCEGNMEGWVLPDSFCSHAERREEP